MKLGSSRPNAKAPPPVPPPSATPAPPGGRRWLVPAAVVAVLAAGLAGAVYVAVRSRPAPPPDVHEAAPLPELSASPFLNTRPGVAYVGDEKCAGCHANHDKTYHAHPMGQSLFPAAAATPVERYDAASNNPFQAGPFRYHVTHEGGQVVHREWCENARGEVVAEVKTPVQYAVGSGTQSRSYLVDRGGLLFESPITWYRDSAAWHLSPGFEANNRHFSREIASGCVFCHCQEARPVAHTLNEYRTPPFGQLAIGCERCHGPGELHVARRKEAAPAQAIDDTIVNPRHLAAPLREAVCQQCHLQGEDAVERRGRSRWDYRPGLPLEEFVTVFVRPPEFADAKRIVGHTEQMYESACFTKGNGAFGCVSCHDPHGRPAVADRPAFYRQKCQACHAADARPPAAAPECSAPAADRATRGDDCTACHMPRSPSHTNHLAVTDHRVLRDPAKTRKPAPTRLIGGLPIVAFHRPAMDPDDPELCRDVAVAAAKVSELARADGNEQLRMAIAGRALPLLDRAAARAPNDVPAVTDRGFILLAHGRGDDADRAADAALAAAPDGERQLVLAFEAAAVRGRWDAAADHCRRLTARYPTAALHHERLALALSRQKAWPQAADAARAGLRIDPFRGELRGYLVTALLEAGDPVAARAEFDKLAVIDPARHAKLRPAVEPRLR